MNDSGIEIGDVLQRYLSGVFGSKKKKTINFIVSF